MPTLTEDQIIEAIRPVQDPDLGRSLVELNMVKGVEIDGSRIKINVELTTPACPLRGKIEDDVRAAAVTVPGVDDVTIRKALLERHAIEIGGGLGAFKGKAWRIGLMGHGATPEAVDRVLAALRTELR